ncbi:MAG: hypothetical protein SVK54_04760, partial [candidate division WOR-3 bacterium]|nr:hypothetical protein [candidate division WOR-3 bacterium]
MQRFILLSLVLLPIFILSSVVYVYDSDTGELLSIVKIEENGITRQVLTPFSAYSDSIAVGLVGYRDTVVSLTGDTLHIGLSPVSFIEDTITVSGRKFTPDRQTTGAGSDPESALRGLSYMLDVRKYSNTLSLSMDGSTAEQTGITLNGFDIINPAAGVIDPELVPIIQSESVSITRNAAHKSITGRFRGSIDITMPNADNGLYLEAGRNIRAGGFAGFRGHIAGFIYSRKKDIILPDGSILANSYSRSMKTYFRFEQRGFRMLYLSSRKRAGDPGPEGSAFLNAYTAQNLKHLQISSIIERVSVKFALNDHFSHYSNPRIGEGIDSRSHAGNMYISASGNTYLGNLGLSV